MAATERFEDVLALLADARARNSNLLLNTGPLPDGSIDAEDEAVLRKVGAHIREHGLPEPKLLPPENPSESGTLLA